MVTCSPKRAVTGQSPIPPVNRSRGGQALCDMPIFEFTFSDAFLIEMFRRYRRSKRLAPYATLLKVFLGLCLTGLMVLCVHGKIYGAAPILSVFLVLLIFARRIDEFRMGRRFRKSPYRDERIRIQLSADGFDAKGTKSSAQLSWAVFTGARRLEDGFLLFQGPGVFNWLPLRAITEGTVEEAEELIRTNVSDYKRI